ncbi:MAG: ROK family protein [Sarcina sp.]
MQKLYVGVDLGGTKIYTALANANGEILREIIVATEAQKGAEQIINKIKDSIRYVSEEVTIKEVAAIGIGSPGPLEVKKGIIAQPPNLPIRNYNIVEDMENEFGVKVYLDNDANAATLAEYTFGQGVGTENMVFITSSTGVGGGAVLNGKLYRGSTSNALELGHTTVKYDGRVCGCGNRGCVESLASGTAIRLIAKDSINGNTTTLSKYEEVTAKEVFDEARNGDLLAKSIIRECIGYLGVAVANAANTLDPDMIVLGGGVINGGDIIFEIIEEEMKERCLSTIKKNCKVRPAKLGGKAGVLGAIALAVVESK